MWVNRQLFQLILDDNKAQQKEILDCRCAIFDQAGRWQILQQQKAKDDITIDWLRNRVNALEKERAILWQRASGIALPTPEIEISKPRAVKQPDFNTLPSFEDPGDDEAKRLGIQHDDMGELIYAK